MDFARLVADLAEPRAYPWPVDSVDVIETHISWVFLAADRVVKLKRPVDLGFVDHTARPDRHRACVDEVRLNRRLTDDVYLGVVPIRTIGGRYQVGDTIEPGDPSAPGISDDCEWGVLMRRLPADRMLNALLRHGSVPPGLADRLAGRLIPFHADIPECASRGEARESASQAAAVITENLDQLEPFAGAPLGRTELRLVSDAMHDFVSNEAPLLERRAADGWIREGHGDLRTEHVCLEGGLLQIFDCVEFSRDIRCADVASDLAFLLMDLTRLGHGDVADDLVERYRTAGFDLPNVVLRYYRVHRALVRAKVACMELADADGVAARRYADEAGDYLDVATAQALTVGQALFLMSGLSGTGKSTVARAIARACNVPIVASDVVRKELAGRSGPAPADWGQGIYAAEWTARTYERLRDLARQRLQAGQGVVVDATFLDAEQRTRFAAEAAAAGVPAFLVETVCDPDTALARIRSRAAQGGSSSDAYEAIYLQQRQMLADHPLGIPAGAIGVTIDTNDDQPGRLDPLFVTLADRKMVRSALTIGAPSG